MKRWVNRYIEEKSIKRHNRKPISYKITKEQVKYAIKKLKENEQITMFELAYNAINQKERPSYLSSSKVISGTSSVGKLQCHSTSLVEATQTQFTQSSKG